MKGWIARGWPERIIILWPHKTATERLIYSLTDLALNTKRFDFKKAPVKQVS